MSERSNSTSEVLIRETASEYRVVQRISATDAARNFSDLLNRVRYRSESFVIERGGTAVAELRPSAPTRFTGSDLQNLMKSVPKVDEDFLAEIEALSLSQPTVPKTPWDR